MKEPTPLYGAGAYGRYEFTIDGHRVAAYTEVTEETWWAVAGSSRWTANGTSDRRSRTSPAWMTSRSSRARSWLRTAIARESKRAFLAARHRPRCRGICGARASVAVRSSSDMLGHVAGIGANRRDSPPV